MLGGGETEVECGEEARKILLKERDRIEPEAGERLGSIQAISAGPKRLESPVAKDEPEHLVGFERQDDEFPDPRPFVIVLLRPEIEPRACA